MRQKTRMIAASMVAAVALGIAAPAASAVEANRTVATATSRSAAVTPAPQAESFPQVELSSESAARAEGERAARGKLGALKELLKKSPALFKAAVKAAKRGAAAFERWVNSLSNFNPVKWAIKAAPGVVISELIAWLADQVI
ncbi:hypothetical protein [Streptomyces viridochromogenes]|uniref:hypothetical protein n=1 Tax=Streptomyces viridochromogenes TaxID=1938 RepID=UPI00069F9240|nr:hypothetical protein [Streptomyces viridochromogenes]KOG06970.1 hypothetical protein ADK35_44745 [Streptomyces viridochromogenes]KOG12177.1 hypothetical protein ADK36_35815 [Streptomyces viridochromogenes]